MKKRQEVMITKKGSHNNNNNKRSARKSPVVRYVECQRNHAAYIGGHAVDGCREFIAATVGGKDLTVEAELSCAACGCHRNFHRKEVVEITSEVVPDSYSSPSNNSTLY
ncbi:hypothetical protein ABFX02_04G156700 [Erythranthe guttata]